MFWWEQTLPVIDPNYKCMQCDSIGATELVGSDRVVEGKKIWICNSCACYLFERDDSMFPLPYLGEI